MALLLTVTLGNFNIFFFQVAYVKVHYVDGAFHSQLFYFCLYICKSITLVQSVLIQFLIGENVLITLSSGFCWAVWTATTREIGNLKRHTFVHANSNQTGF
jgi:phage antirepressor YoqD-like protein